MTLLVVGGAGFIGSHLVDLLIKRRKGRVVVVDNFFLGRRENLIDSMDRITIHEGDARDIGTMRKILNKEMPSTIFNLAVQPLSYCFVNPRETYMTSVEVAHNLATLLQEGRYGKLVHFSSSEVYGTAAQMPMGESHPMNPTTPYGSGKASADLLLLSYHKWLGLDISIIRPFNTYGPRQNAGSYAAVIPLTIRRILNGQRPVVEGDGEQTRDFTYVEDICEAALAIMDRGAGGRVINIGQGREMSIGRIIQMVCGTLGYDGEVEYRPARLGDVRRHLADTSLARRLINYSPTVNLAEGIRLTVEWFRALNH